MDTIFVTGILEEVLEEGATTTTKSRFDKHWREFSRNDFWYALDCPQMFERRRTGEDGSKTMSSDPIPTSATWKYLRDTYRAVVGSDQSSIFSDDLDNSNDDNIGYDGFYVKIEPKQTKDHGRGVFANQYIPKGTLVWNTQYTARFPNPHTYREFLLAVSPDLACEIMPWSYIQSLATFETLVVEGSQEELKQQIISIDMDYGALINGGLEYVDDDYDWQESSHEDDDNDYANIGCSQSVKDYDTGYNVCAEENYYALRDIRKGEELFVHYRSFSMVGPAWNDIDLQCTVCDLIA